MSHMPKLDGLWQGDANDHVCKRNSAHAHPVLNGLNDYRGAAVVLGVDSGRCEGEPDGDQRMEPFGRLVEPGRQDAGSVLELSLDSPDRPGLIVGSVFVAQAPKTDSAGLPLKP